MWWTVGKVMIMTILKHETVPLKLNFLKTFSIKQCSVNTLKLNLGKILMNWDQTEKIHTFLLLKLL